MDEIEVVVGRIGKPHGLRGEVTVEVRTDEPERRFAAGSVLTGKPREGPERQLTVATTRRHQETLLVRFAELGDRSAAEAARGLLLHTVVDPSDTPEDPEEFYDHQLVGLRVRDETAADLGEVVRVLHGGAQDLLAVRTTDGREALVPFVHELVPEVDLAKGQVTVADRPGLVSPLPEG